MKKLRKSTLLLSLMSFIMISMGSCHKENEDNALYGVWQNNAFIYCFKSNGSGYWQYSPDNGLYEVHGDKKSYFRWSASENLVSIVYDGSGLISAGTTNSFYYEVNGNMLVMIDTESGDTHTYTRKNDNSNSSNEGLTDKMNPKSRISITASM